MTWVAGLVMALGALAAMASAAQAETRTLKLYFIHTGEKAEITFKRNGTYDKAGLQKVNQFLRDWRRNEPTRMDPRLLDLVWETYRSVGGRDYINVVSAYRSPKTNGMLRSRSKGVAEKSQHMLGKAMDFFIPGVPLKKLRDAGLKMQVGGVGYYPRSGSPFVHLDVGNVRHWPRMSRRELVSVFPNGKTLHVPSDGKPLPGFEAALASYQARKKSGATALALASTKPAKSGGFLSNLFGGGADEDEDSGGGEEAPVVTAKVRPAEVQVAKADAKAAGKIRILPPELADPVEPPAPVEAETEPQTPETQTPEAIIAALPARSIPLPAFAPRPKAEVGVAVASAEAEAVPFGMAATAESDAVAPEGLDTAEQVAANVPLPTRRPDASPQVVPESDDDAVALAMVQDPAEAGSVDAARSLMMGAAPLPQARPSDDDALALPETVAALPSAGPMDSEAEIAAQVKVNQERLARLEQAATPRSVVAELPRGGDAGQAIGGVRTTAKSARATVRDRKPAAKPLVVAAQPDAARWALSANAYVAPTPTSEAVASIARSLVREAPAEVYASGFSQSKVADAGRFSGKAVSFLPVAKFTATN